MLAQAAWPRPELRPAGDLDLLIGQAELERARAALAGLGFRAASAERPSRLRPAQPSIELSPPPGKRVTVDLHTRLFRSVGGGVDAAPLIARARPAELCGQPVRALEPADQLLFVAVHAAKHAVRALKWLLDLHALATQASNETWELAIERARATGTARPFWAAMRLVDQPRVAQLAPPAPVRQLLERLITVESALRSDGRLRGWERYALEVSLEPSLLRRARMALGVAERLVRLPFPAQRG
jgi:hypothetical protein